MSGTLLSEDLKAEIQRAYRAWLAARGFRPRRGQREMIAEIARVLTGPPPRMAAVEAGTGTGKTAAYGLAVIPVARALGKRVVISTATVALQEQVVLRDLPDLAAGSGLGFSHALAKGRGRYVCLKRLDDRLRYQQQAEIPLFEAGTEEGIATYQAMLAAFGTRRWDGELDSWDGAVDERIWRAVTTDHRGCANNRCTYFRQCPFFRARGTLEGVDVIVANHDLVLADLALGGGAVLPEPEDCIYVFDEAHHLPEKTRNHFATAARLAATSAWAESVTGVLGTLTQRMGRPDELLALATAAGDAAARCQETLRDLQRVAGELRFQMRDDTLGVHRFPLGRVPESLRATAHDAAGPAAALGQLLERAHTCLQDVMAGERAWPNGHEAEDWLPVIGQHLGRAGALLAVLEQFAASEDPDGVRARWVNRHDNDLELVSAPIEPGRLLAARLWSRCHAAVCTSATLTALGSFARFFEQAGLAGVEGLRIPSPFDFPSIATFSVPRMASDPRDGAAHTEEVARLLPELVEGEPGALVLFASWRQLRDVVARLPAKLVARMKIQGDASKQVLIAAHRADVDRNEPTVLVGLASFAEGIDLPDDYCRHVIIVKLPFAVPDDPVDQAMAEWAEAQGRNAFFEIAVPDAALRLVQACGRLIRHEGDHGRITLLDRRVVTQRYGRALLASLPPYRFELNADPPAAASAPGA
jgi:ATP-dependent DNA helicase DinG